jgi:BirA family biotin operon repressor/biotin-[acetyl-CoA-carboxylase] ligase
MIARVENPQQPTRGGPSAAAAGLDAGLLAERSGLPVACVEVVDAIDSTNRELMTRPLAQAVAPEAPAVRLLLADRQLAGRGRRGRVWLSDPADSLTFSVAVDHRRTPSTPVLAGLSVALGVAVAQAASAWAGGLGLKWPNDLLRDGRKCAGLLVESRIGGEVERIVAGLGVNIRLPDDIARAIDQPACGLFEPGAAVPRKEVLAGRLGRALIDATLRFLAHGFAGVAADWARFDVLAGRQVTILEAGRPTLVGRADGLDDTGALRLLTATGPVTVAVGEVSARLGDLTRPTAGDS